MSPILDPLVLDLVAWVAAAPKAYPEVIEAWRTSCPRLTVWEDALEHGYVACAPAPAGGVVVSATARGRDYLRANGRIDQATGGLRRCQSVTA